MLGPKEYLVHVDQTKCSRMNLLVYFPQLLRIFLCDIYRVSCTKILCRMYLYESLSQSFYYGKIDFHIFLPTFAHASLPTGCSTLSWITCLCGSGRLSWCSRLLCRLCRTKRGGFHDEGPRLCRVWAGRACRTCNDLNERVMIYTYSCTASQT